MGPSEATMNMVNAYIEGQKPIYHRTINLGIRAFKAEMRRLNPKAKRSAINKLIKAYKKRAWMQTDGVIRGKGSFPTHPKYGKDVKVTTTDMDVEYEIKVKNGQK